ncbi:MAG: NUDIX domain-containing protein [Acidobacteria bacterium]|nr:NUDIX domain-containing protein [Acidobacteriota bacterium]
MAHLHYAIDFTIACFIVKGDRVLMIFHKGLGKWLPIGGHIEMGEDPDQALFREIREECGLEVEIMGEKAPFEDPEVKILYTPAHVNIHRITDTHSHVVNIYYARGKVGEPVLSAGEHREIRWFSQEELRDPRYGVKPDVLWYAEDALARVGVRASLPRPRE